MYHLACVNCGATYPADEILYNCKKCGHLLAVKYPLDEITCHPGSMEQAAHLCLEIQGTAAGTGSSRSPCRKEVHPSII